MFSRLFTTLILTGIFGTAVIMAHDPSQHKGTPTKGEVLSIAGSRIELKTEKGVKTVALDDKTAYERGIFGTTLASGEIVAKEVFLDAGATTAAPKHDQAHKH
jgi:hypothetical protein